MPVNYFGHVDLRVTEMAVALPFYEKLLPAMGFETAHHGKTFNCFSGIGELPATPWFGFTEDPDHRPNLNRIAFWTSSREAVDAAARVAAQAGAGNISGPRDCVEYSPTYYAVFFEDPCGNCLEVYHRTD